MSADDGVKGHQAGMRHHGCKLNEVITLGGCKIMGSSLESSGLPGLTVKFNDIPPHVSSFILSAFRYLVSALTMKLHLTFRVPY